VPRPSKGPRLQLRPARPDRQAIWVILDTGHEESTGCGAHDRAGAEQAFAGYLARKHVSKVSVDDRDPSEVPVADIIALYAANVAKSHARPEETAARLNTLLDFFGEDMLSDINGARCREFAAACATDAVARRHLEDFRAAINHHRREGLHNKIVEVVLPAKRQPRVRWLTKKEAALLVRRAWRYRETQQGVLTDRRPRRQAAKFTLVALYTGTRASLVCGAALEPTAGHGYVDVDRGLFYRKPPGSVVTKKRAPPIPLPARLLTHLRRWKRLGQKFVVEHNGAPVKRVSKSFRQTVAAAGLGPEVTPHTLRHTSATWLMQAGTDPWVAAGYLGMTVETLLENYGHHHPSHLEGARTAFARLRIVK
jgi:integrase